MIASPLPRWGTAREAPYLLRCALLSVAIAACAGPPGAARAAQGLLDVRTFGARGDGATDDSRAFQAALDAARAAGGGVVFVPAGTYVVAPPAGRDAAAPRLRSLTIGSGVSLRGEGPASVLKVKGGIGSYRSLFMTDAGPGQDVQNVTVSDLRVDQNCQQSGGFVRTGRDGESHFTVLLSYGGRNITVERMVFDPVCGVNTVSLNASGARNLVVRDSRFRFVRGPTDERTGTYDNTAVYLHGQGTVAVGNVFESTPAEAARGAIELHGSSGVASGNVTRGYQSCVRVAGTSNPDERPPPDNAFTVADNRCSDAKDAINVWSITNHHVRGVAIRRNAITLAELDHLAQRKEPAFFYGISFVWDAVSGGLNGDVSDVVIEDNTIAAQRADGLGGKVAQNSGGIALTSAGNIANVVVRGNAIRDLPSKGIHVQSMGRRTRASNVRIEGNVVTDAGNDASAGENRAGIVVSGVLQDVEVVSNSIGSTIVPFRGLYAIHAAPAAGSARVDVRDNAWSTADPGASYVVSLEGLASAARASPAVAPWPRESAREVVRVDVGALAWDVAIRSEDLSIRAPARAAPGQRLTIRLRNERGGPLRQVEWRGFKVGPWKSPPPGSDRVLEFGWDGTAWSDVAPPN